MQDTDPDTLQLLDETDEKWVSLWRKAGHKKTARNKITFYVPSTNKLPESNKKIISKKKHA